MRIAFFVHYFPQLSEAFVINQAAALIARGHQVDIYSIWGLKAYTPEQYPAVAAAQLMNVCFHPEFQIRLIPRLVKAVQLARSRFSGRGRVLINALNVLRFGQWAANLRLVFESAMLDGRGPYDVVHCQFADLAPVVLRLREVGALPAPIVVHIRGIDITRRPREMGKKPYLQIFAKADLLLANCDYFREKAIQLGCPESKVQVYRSAIDVREFRYRGPRESGGGIALALVGRLTEKKGIAYAIQAVAELERRGRKVCLSILGDGPLRASLMHLSQTLGVFASIRFLGAGSQPEVMSLLERSDIILAPSVSAADGDEDAPVNSLKEGMAIGLPVIATRHGGIPEMIEDEVSGRLVSERDFLAIADAVEWLLSRQTQWAAFGKAGRAIVERDYEISRQTETLISVYRSLVAQPANP